MMGPLEPFLDRGGKFGMIRETWPPGFPGITVVEQDERVFAVPDVLGKVIRNAVVTWEGSE